MLNLHNSSALTRAREKMRDAGISEIAIKNFTAALTRVADSPTAYIPESSLTPLTKDQTLIDTDIPADEMHDAIAHTAVLKLNGGLATSIGGPRAKVLLPVSDGQTFLDAIVNQVRYTRDILGVELPLIFMNSRNTHVETLAHVPSDVPVQGIDTHAVQNIAPKLKIDTLEPITWARNPELEWAPFGHGDFFATIFESRILTQLIAQGYRYLAVSNLDNLGATPSAEIAGWFARSGAPMMMEVCQRTSADVKGGHVAVRHSDGRLILRERAQAAETDMDYFTDEKRHRFFNTNNIWFDLHALREKLVESGGVMNLTPILNRRHVDPADPSSPEIVQVESAIGAAIELFPGAQVLEVSRDRFVPIKTASDLERFRSERALGPNGMIRGRAALGDGTYARVDLRRPTRSRWA